MPREYPEQIFIHISFGEELALSKKTYEYSQVIDILLRESYNMY